MRFLIVVLQFAIVTAGAAQAAAPSRVRLRLDTAEAVAVLAILEARQAGRPVPAGSWQRLFVTDGYRRLKAREQAMQREFSDSDFAAFVRSDTLGRRTGALRRALSEWERADVTGAAGRALAYLPPEARIQATVYVVIKPVTNSFVFEVQTDPAIFLYLDPTTSKPKFENTVAHELHHIGYAGVSAQSDSSVASLSDSVRPAAEWMGAFGEGFAMLAAAGGPDSHPHAASPPAERARWDRDVANFDRDLHTLNRFFLDIISHRLATPDTVRTVAFSFFGEQGPWYTVGWKMAAMIERRFGRDELIRCMLNPGRLLARYNTAAGDSAAHWSPALLQALGMEGR